MEERRRQDLLSQLAEDEAALTAATLRQGLDPLMSLTITFPQLKVLLLVVAGDALTVHGLADRLGVSAPTMSGLVDRLVEQGLVARHEDAADRRVRRLVATARGDQVVGTILDTARGRREQVLELLDTDDLAALAQGIRAVRRALGAEAPDAAGRPGRR